MAMNLATRLAACCLMLGITQGFPLSAAMAEPAGKASHSHIHAADEIAEDHGPLLVEVLYTGEVISNRGGQRNGTRYLDNLDLVAEADLEQLAGWRGAQAHVYGLYNNGRSISDLTGDSQAVSNIETGVRAIRLYEAWIEQRISDAVSLRLGLYDLNSEFDTLEASGLFVGSAHGIGTDISQSGVAGPSIFPFTSLSSRIEVDQGRWKVRAAVLDAVPGDPDRPRRTAIQLSRREGALLIGEGELSLPSGKLLLGHWRYTARFTDHAGFSGRGNAGFYLRGEQTITRDAAGNALDAFFRLGVAKGRFNMFDRFASAGIKWTGVHQNEAGLAIASAFTSPSYRAICGCPRVETAIEASYRVQFNDFLGIQPNVQWVINPASAPGIGNAVVAGLRFQLAWRIAG